MALNAESNTNHVGLCGTFTWRITAITEAKGVELLDMKVDLVGDASIKSRHIPGSAGNYQNIL